MPNLSARPREKRVTDCLLVMLLFALLIRLAVGIGYYNAQDTFWYRSWAFSLPDGLFDVYARADEISLDYPPVYLFFLYITGWMYRLIGADCHAYVQMFLMKLWPILGDFLCGLALYAVFGRKSRKTGLLAAALWLFNPATLFNCAFWGQTDSIMCLMLFVSFAALERDRPILASVLFALAGMTKYQCLLFVPVFLTELFIRCRVKVFFGGIAAAAATVAAVFLPFMIGAKDPFLFFHVYLGGQDSYPYCTLNAFNLYGVLGLNWVKDTDPAIGGLTFRMISLFVTILAVLGLIAFYLFTKRRSMWVMGYLFMNTLFMLTTRMHERYQFVVLIFLLAAVLEQKDRGLFYGFAGMSAMILINQLIPMFSWHGQESFFNVYYGELMTVFSAVNLILYLVTGYLCIRLLCREEPAAPESIRNTAGEPSLQTEDAR